MRMCFQVSQQIIDMYHIDHNKNYDRKITKIIWVDSVSNLRKQSSSNSLEDRICYISKNKGTQSSLEGKKLTKREWDWPLAFTNPSQPHALRGPLTDWATNQFWPWVEAYQEMPSHQQGAVSLKFMFLFRSWCQLWTLKWSLSCIFPPPICKQFL